MATQAEINQIAIDNRTALNSITEKGKLQSELTNQTSITDSTEFLVIQKGTDDANKVSIPISRGSLGDWNASSNDPSLVNGTGVGGDKYIVTVAGTQDFGDGSITFSVGDFVEYISSKWEKKANTIELSDLKSSVSSVSATYTVLTSDSVIECTSNTFTLTLPTAVGVNGKTFIIKNSGTGTITIDGDGTETIDDSLTALLSSKYDSITIISNGTNWIIT